MSTYMQYRAPYNTYKPTQSLTLWKHGSSSTKLGKCVSQTYSHKSGARKARSQDFSYPVLEVAVQINQVTKQTDFLTIPYSPSKRPTQVQPNKPYSPAL